MTTVSIKQEEEGLAEGTATQYSTFWISDRLYGIDVVRVQEVTKAMRMSQIPKASKFVHGLINLRGQIATAISLRDLFQQESAAKEVEQMNVVCNIEGNLLSFLVDEIGDVIEVEASSFEPPPETVQSTVRQFMVGVYKLENHLLSILQVDKIIEYLNKGESH